MTAKRFRSFLLIFSVLALILTGCNLPQNAAVQPTETATEIVEDTPEPTETPTPLPARDKIAFIPSDEEPDVTDNLTRALTTVCANFDCETITSEDQIDNETDFVIFAKAPTALDSLSQRFPQARFIVVSSDSIVNNNTWTIRYDEAFLPFLAGLATTSNATDWRSAGLIPTDSPIWGSHAEEAFRNGAHYFCGNCMSSLAPYVSFPVVIAMPGDTSADSWSAQFDEAQRNFIYTAFLSDEAISEALLQKLISLNVQMLGVSNPPAGLENNWLASINFDWADTILQIIAQCQSGKTQGTQPLILSITPGQLSEDFSSGKETLLRKAYSDLLSGLLSPYTPTNEYTEQ